MIEIEVLTSGNRWAAPGCSLSLSAASLSDLFLAGRVSGWPSLFNLLARSGILARYYTYFYSYNGTERSPFPCLACDVVMAITLRLTPPCIRLSSVQQDLAPSTVLESGYHRNPCWHIQ
jgi:hypothetical protein